MISTMKRLFGTPRSEPLEAIATSFGRVRCPQPPRIERIRQSLQQYGQLSPVLVVRRQQRLELLDGFKRRRAAELLGWTTLLVAEAELDETAQWATMLLVNQRAASALADVEEALILRELVGTGLTQVEIGALLERHKSWVSRRIGLIERLHPELIAAIKLGLLAPGVARRLLALPPGNQLRMAAAVQSARLGPRDTERMVGLWQKESSEACRRELLADPRSVLSRFYPETQRAQRLPQLSPPAQRLQRLLGVVVGAAARTIVLLATPPAAAQTTLLRRELRSARQTLRRLLDLLGPDGSETSNGAGDARSASG
jgi:ParB/RepB/Spo0J family partition protein